MSLGLRQILCNYKDILGRVQAKTHQCPLQASGKWVRWLPGLTCYLSEGTQVTGTHLVVVVMSQISVLLKLPEPSTTLSWFIPIMDNTRCPRTTFSLWSPDAFCCDSRLLFLTITQNCTFSVFNFVVFVFETSITMYLPSPFFLQILPYPPPCFPSNSLKASLALIFIDFRNN